MTCCRPYSLACAAGLDGPRASMTPLDEGGLPEHRSERQAPRRTTRTIIPNAAAEPPCERSVFGKPVRLFTEHARLFTEHARRGSPALTRLRLAQAETLSRSRTTAGPSGMSA